MGRTLGLPAAIVGLVAGMAVPSRAWADAGGDGTGSAGVGGPILVLFGTCIGYLLIPGIGLSFAGLVRRKNVLTTFQHSFSLLGLVTLLWCAIGYSLVFSPSRLGGLIGGLDHVGLAGLGLDPAPPNDDRPGLLNAWLHLLPATFALAIVSGAAAERLKFSAYILFGSLWLLLVFCPIDHWVWGGGWMARTLGPIDHAGGLVIQVPAGISAYCAAMVLGRRRGFGQEDRLPHNLTLTAVGTALLWIGWLGLGIARSAGDLGAAILSAFNLYLAAGAGLVSWSVVEWIHKGRVTMLGSCTGAVAGLVSASAGAAFVDPMAALLIGLLVCPLGYGAVVRRGRSGIDDALDVSAIHGLCGALGVLALILLARADHTVRAGRGVGGLLEGQSSLIVSQAASLALIAVYCFLATLILLKLVDRLVGLRISADDEDAGLDLSQHGGRGYILEAGEAFILRSRNVLDLAGDEAYPNPEQR